MCRFQSARTKMPPAGAAFCSISYMYVYNICMYVCLHVCMYVLMGVRAEFNVRKRMLPVALLFKTRARDGDKLKSDLFANPSEVPLLAHKCLSCRTHICTHTCAHTRALSRSHTDKYTHTHTHMHMHMHTHTTICTQLEFDTNMYKYMMYVYMHTLTHSRTHTHTNICICIYIHL